LSTEKFEFTRSLLVLGNLAILCWVLLASLSFTFVNPLYGWLFLLFASAVIFLFLRRLGCSSCYYCKSCTSGFGRLAGWFFGKRSLKDTNNKTALGFVVTSYFLLGPLPIVFLTASLSQSLDALRIVLLSFLVVFSLFSVATWLNSGNGKETKP